MSRQSIRLEVLNDLHRHLVQIAERKRKEGKRLIGEHAALKRVATQILEIQTGAKKHGKRIRR